MGQFIKLPKSTTDLTSFDLMHLFSGVAEILSDGNTTLQVRMIATPHESNKELPLYEITTNVTMTNAQRLQMIQNLSKAVQEATSKPKSVPSLVVVDGVTISSLAYRQVL